MRSIRISWVGNYLFLRARGCGIDLQEREKIANPRGCARGGIGTGKIEPCIIQLTFCGCVESKSRA